MGTMNTPKPPTDLDAHVAKIVKDWPPMTDQRQLDRIAALLRAGSRYPSKGLSWRGTWGIAAAVVVAAAALAGCDSVPSPHH
jgi:hypothetical protein